MRAEGGGKRATGRACGGVKSICTVQYEAPGLLLAVGTGEDLWLPT